ncbi:MAG: ScyD/ScyE family protein [Actinobacteria bacterium]|nr:ScyD/ScyE family protein [Actinomycetota bacterium]
MWAMPDGSVYIAEAGTAGPQKLDKKTFLGYTASVARWRPSGTQRVVRKLGSVGGRDGTFTGGAHGVAVDRRGTIYVAMTGAPCNLKLPAAAKAQAGQLLRIRAGKQESVADIESLECKHNYDRTDRNPNPYAVLALGGDHEIVVDAGGNTAFDVRGKQAKLLAVLPKLPDGGQSVPTSVALGPDGAYYVGEFAGEIKGKLPKNRARVLRIVPGKKPTVYRRGFNAITGLAFDKQGTMYVTEFSTEPANEQNAAGDVVAVAKNGTRTRLGVGKLFFPTGAAVGPDGSVYVSNWSILPGTPPKGGPFKGKSGQLVRIRK